MLWGLSYRYDERAGIYSIPERHWRENAQPDLDQGETRTLAARLGSQIADYYAPLVRKYRRAMWRPSISVDLDPPPPSEIPQRSPDIR
jgi:hypothetical protein